MGVHRRIDAQTESNCGIDHRLDTQAASNFGTDPHPWVIERCVARARYMVGATSAYLGGLDCAPPKLPYHLGELMTAQFVFSSISCAIFHQVSLYTRPLP